MINSNWQIQVYIQPGDVVGLGSPGYGFAADASSFDFKSVQSSDDALLTVILFEWPETFNQPTHEQIRDADLDQDWVLRQKLAVSVMSYSAAERAMGYHKGAFHQFSGGWKVEAHPKAQPPPLDVLSNEEFTSFGIRIRRLKLNEI
jgi:hypothetical protein